MGNAAGGLAPSNFDPARIGEGNSIGVVAGQVVPVAIQPTNQGLAQLLLTQGATWTTANITSGETDFDDTPIPGMSGTFVAPYTGVYVLAVNVGPFLSTAVGIGTGLDATFRVKVTGATTTSVGYSNKAGGTATAVYTPWFMQLRGGSMPQPGHFIGVVFLNAGTHTLTLQGRGVFVNAASPIVISGGLATLQVMAMGGTAAAFYQQLAFRQISVGTTWSNTAANNATWSSAGAPTGHRGPPEWRSSDIGGNGTPMVIPATGKYRIRVQTQLGTQAASWGKMAFRFLVDGVSVMPSDDTSLATFGWKFLVGNETGAHRDVDMWIEATLTAGTHSWELQAKTAEVAGTPSVQTDGNDTIMVSVEGGAAVNASLDTRGDSWDVDHELQLNSGGSGTEGPFFAGYAPATGALRGFSIGLDGATVTAGTLAAQFLVGGAVVATVTLNTTDTVFKVDSATTPVVPAGSKIEVQFVKTGLTLSATPCNVGLRAFVSLSTSINQLGEQTPIKMAWVANGQVSLSAKTGSLMALNFNDGRQRLHSGTLTFDFANGTGANGLDTGAEAASTWYYLYAVPAGVGDFMLKASTTSPVGGGGPTGQTVWKYIGAFRNNASSNIFSFFQDGRTFWFTANDPTRGLDGPQPAAMPHNGNNFGGYVAGSQTAYTEYSIADTVPATACLWHFTGYITRHTFQGFTLWIYLTPQGGGNLHWTQYMGDTANHRYYMRGTVPLPTATKSIGYYIGSDNGSINLRSGGEGAFFTKGWDDEFVDARAAA